MVSSRGQVCERLPPPGSQYRCLPFLRRVNKKYNNSTRAAWPTIGSLSIFPVVAGHSSTLSFDLYAYRVGRTITFRSLQEAQYEIIMQTIRLKDEHQNSYSEYISNHRDIVHSQQKGGCNFWGIIVIEHKV